MKKLLAAALCVTMLSACGTPKELTIQGKTKEYPTYGFLNKDSNKSEKVCYEISYGNLTWSVLLAASIIVPVYFVGFSLYNPTHEKVENSCGIDN